jgi:hypothetical protein
MKQFEDALETWDSLLEMNASELNTTLVKMKTVRKFIDDFNEGQYWVQQPDDIFVIAQDVANLWRDVILVVEEAIEYQESLGTSFCKK